MGTHPEVADWLEKYPEPKGTAPLASKEQVREWLLLDDNKTQILDLRKHDFQGGNIRGALCAHYTGVYSSVEDIWRLLKGAGKTRIVVHCWSSRKRAVKTAGWFYDSLVAHNEKDIEVYVLEGGIKGWVDGGKQYTDLMVEFDPSGFS
ncbi:Rhodanese-like domain-containing protein [Yarrowia lipolytica]|uniref:Rhodanese-like domain-containing protein n=1 Tax=Yarrowia lipolytica TaxID=4952 RepID=A0A371C4U2_YARLL|nr:Rhodanese-like domain-containing protein [Yarrowia lipolytica]RDW31740.1 Rhodanese-like domain-containing protein [Yarrowia lipolytica]RDW38610.1 Rhodanese-like domain-containing protein [Yarrowia lipolytica]RDW43895.1 Rhodanese-like domain-containing protein [Yarrowia lipolytica]RDW50601.1 Rhodanese-like domain-containing protein [Yarrowia lipolytica]